MRSASAPPLWHKLKNALQIMDPAPLEPKQETPAPAGAPSCAFPSSRSRFPAGSWEGEQRAGTLLHQLHAQAALRSLWYDGGVVGSPEG